MELPISQSNSKITKRDANAVLLLEDFHYIPKTSFESNLAEIENCLRVERFELEITKRKLDGFERAIKKSVIESQNCCSNVVIAGSDTQECNIQANFNKMSKIQSVLDQKTEIICGNKKKLNELNLRLEELNMYLKEFEVVKTKVKKLAESMHINTCNNRYFNNFLLFFNGSIPFCNLLKEIQRFENDHHVKLHSMLHTLSIKQKLKWELSKHLTDLLFITKGTNEVSNNIKEKEAGIKEEINSLVTEIENIQQILTLTTLCINKFTGFHSTVWGTNTKIISTHELDALRSKINHLNMSNAELEKEISTYQNNLQVTFKLHIKKEGREQETFSIVDNLYSEEETCRLQYYITENRKIFNDMNEKLQLHINAENNIQNLDKEVKEESQYEH